MRFFEVLLKFIMNVCKNYPYFKTSLAATACQNFCLNPEFQIETWETKITFYSFRYCGDSCNKSLSIGGLHFLT